MGGQAACIGNNVGGTRDARRNLRDFLRDLQSHRITFVDLRANLQFDTHVLTFDGVKRLTRILNRAASNKGYVLAYYDFGFFVIQRQ